MQKAGESRSPCLRAGARGRAELLSVEGVSEGLGEGKVRSDEGAS